MDVIELDTTDNSRAAYTLSRQALARITILPHSDHPPPRVTAWRGKGEEFAVLAAGGCERQNHATSPHHAVPSADSGGGTQRSAR